MKYLSAIIICVITLSLNIQAQQGQGGASKTYTELLVSSSATVVKGAPFSAEAISESVQTLADGNKISRRNTTKMFRDGEGRFRREITSSGTAGSGYSYANSGTGFTTFGFQDMITIFDSVANVRYTLIPATKTAQRALNLGRIAEVSTVVSGLTASKTAKAQSESNVARQAETFAATRTINAPFPFVAATTYSGTGATGKTESLGTRSFDGVDAEGTRTVTTIAAGAIGNERPIEMVYERWYSKYLQLIVYSKNSDPRFGEQTYRLVNIKSSEPDRSLFTPPADYKIVNEQTFNVVTTTPK